MGLLDNGGLLGSLLSPIIGDAPTAPTPFDPSKLLQLESQYGRINQNTPFGSLTYGKNGTANMTLSPAYQALMSGSLKGLTGLFGLGTGTAPTFNPGDFTAQGLQAQRAYYKSAMRELKPQIAQQRDQLTQTLADRGLPAGSELYGNLTDQSNRNINDLLTNTALSSIQAGNQRENDLFTQALQKYGANLQGYNANLGNRSSLAQLYLGGLGAVPQLNNFYAPGQIDVGGAYGLNAGMQNNTYDAASKLYGSELSGLFGLGKAAGAYALGGG